MLATPTSQSQTGRHFAKKFPSNVIREVIDRSKIKLPEWFVPLARGVAFASDTLLREAGYRRPSECPSGWRQTECDVFIKSAAADKDISFATLTVRQYANKSWWTVERCRDDRKYENLTDVLVFDFGSTPIFCWDYQSAMLLAEYCQLNGPPPGLSWVAACPDDKDGAIEFARKRCIDEACCVTHS